MRGEIDLERLGYTVIGAFHEVCRKLRPGYLENVYVGALCVELRARGVPFERERPLCVRYKGEAVGHYRADLIVGERLLIEVKAGRHLDDAARWQTLNYLYTTGLTLGLVLYFGWPRKVQRVIASDAAPRTAEHRMRTE